MKFITLSLLFLACHSQAAVTQGDRQYSGWTSSYHRAAPLIGCPSFCDSITRYSTLYQVPKHLVISVIRHESNFNPRAVSPKGAKGLMQLMDMNSKAARIDPFNPDENIRAGTPPYILLKLSLGFSKNEITDYVKNLDILI